VCSSDLKDELMNQVWPDAIVEQNNVEKSISALRKALGEQGSSFPYIETVRGQGYRFTANVRELNYDLGTLAKHESDTSVTIEDEEIDFSGTAPTDIELGRTPQLETKAVLTRPQSFTHLVRLRWRFLLGAVAVLIAAGATAAYYFADREEPTINSIAVMPFVNVTNDPNTEYLSDGITESLINSLSQLRNVKIIARASVFRYQGRAVDPQIVGRELNVQAILTGRVVQRGDEVSISAELVDVRNNAHLWGERYERKVSDLLAVQREITRDISSKLRIKLSGDEQNQSSKLYTQNADAYQLYLKGRFYWNKRTRGAIDESIEYFNQAIERDPGYALAYAGLADSYLLQGGLFISLPAKDIYPKAKAAATKALEIDDQLAEAHTSLALVRFQYDWKWSEAEREFQQAIALNPNYPTAHHWYAFLLSARGRFDEALTEIRRAQQLDPVSLIINTDVAAILFQAGRYDQAIEQCQKSLELDPNFIQAHNILSLIYEQRQMYDQWIAERQKILTLSGESDQAVALGRLYEKSGYTGVLEQRLAELKEHAKSRYVPAFSMAMAYASLGENNRAFEWLDKAFEEHSARMADLEVVPALQRLHSDPRFADLLRRVDSGQLD